MKQLSLILPKGLKTIIPEKYSKTFGGKPDLQLENRAVRIIHASGYRKIATHAQLGVYIFKGYSLKHVHQTAWREHAAGIQARRACGCHDSPSADGDHGGKSCRTLSR